MMPAELHPEEMLDAARAGTLSSGGRSDLEAHLARCPACRLHLRLVDDLSASAEGRCDRDDGPLLASLVLGALSERDEAARDKRRPFRLSPLLRRLILPAACMLLGGGVATAMWSVRSDRRPAPEIQPLETIRPRADSRPTRAGASRTTREQILPEAPRRELDTTSLKPRRPVRRVGVDLASTQGRAPETVRAAATLFAAANRARRDGAHDKALALYDQLRRDFPGSREEITARVIVGQLALARNHPARALVEFDSYLLANPNGTLAEEARVGRATTMFGLGRVDDERQAWLQLLKKHPASIHAERARARLEKLRP